MSALSIKARSAFNEKLTATNAQFFRANTLSPETLAAEVALDLEEIAVEAFAEGLAAGVGREMADVAMADLTRTRRPIERRHDWRQTHAGFCK